ncbi:MAG TPA: nitroreductase [Micromonosporaceae bacterium]|jgi:nitroreductase|nr:nitroreductase [Micromonosporaceae bacterium]
MGTGHTTGETPSRAAAFAEAAAAAGLAPSVHNTQPWHWRVGADELDLYADRTRQLTVADPHGHLLLLSCGAALHHARTALAAQGWQAAVSRFPKPTEPDQLARVTAADHTPVTAEAMRLFQAAEVRHADRRAVSETPVPPEAIDRLRSAAEAEGVHLHLVRPDQAADLASAVAHADAVTVTDPAQRAETAHWVGGARDDGLGVPDSAIPSRPPRTGVPMRDFGRAGTLDPGAGHDRAAAYAVLFGAGDEPVDWLRAGEALSAVWLTATNLGLSVLPLSSVIEVGAGGEAVRRMLSGLGQPYLVLRVGVADPEHPGPPHTGRLPADTVIDT